MENRDTTGSPVSPLRLRPRTLGRSKVPNAIWFKRTADCGSRGSSLLLLSRAARPSFGRPENISVAPSGEHRPGLALLPTLARPRPSRRHSRRVSIARDRGVNESERSSPLTRRWSKGDSNPWSPATWRRVRDHPCRLARIRIPAGETNSFRGGPTVRIRFPPAVSPCKPAPLWWVRAPATPEPGQSVGMVRLRCSSHKPSGVTSPSL